MSLLKIEMLKLQLDRPASVPVWFVCTQIHLINFQLILKDIPWEFPGGPVVKTPHLQWRGQKFYPLSGN